MKPIQRAGLLIISFGLFCGLSACGPGDPAPESARTIQAETITPTEPQVTKTLPVITPSAPSPDPTPTPLADQFPRTHYQIDAALDYYQHKVSVEMEIQIPHPGLETLDEIVLVVPPHAWPGAFSLEELRDGEGNPIPDYRLEGVRLEIPLTEDWLPGEMRQLQLRYLLTLPIQNAREGYGPSPFGYTELQTNLVDWYPMVPPYDPAQGWVVHDPWIFGEYLVYPAADFQVSLAVTNGPEVVVAASAQEEVDANLRSYRLEKGRNFVFSISPNYQVWEQQVGGTLVRGYHFPPYQFPAQAAFETTVEALTLYERVYGPYPQSALSMVQADFNHGMEYEGLFFLSRAMFDSYNGTPESYLIAIAAHETAHQWWYGQVANDQALEPWLDESLCTFTELVFYEQTHPESVDWWWAARINYYQPQGVIDGTIYDFAVPGGDNYESYRQSIYLRGALFISQLREALGEEQFFAFLRSYGERYENQIAAGEDFFAVLGEYQEPESLSWLGEYFRKVPRD